MALFRTSAYVVASIDGFPQEGHYLTVLASADDKEAARVLSTAPDFIAGLFASTIGVDIAEVRVIDSALVEVEAGSVVMAARDAACVLLP